MVADVAPVKGDQHASADDKPIQTSSHRITACFKGTGFVIEVGKNCGLVAEHTAW